MSDHQQARPISATCMTVSTNMECSVCYTKCPPFEITYVDSDAVCHGCITTMFQRAIDHEGDYPVKWGDQTLEINNYRDIIPAYTRIQFREKKAEYETPPSERLYCRAFHILNGHCNAFLGRRTSNGDSILVCMQCRSSTCKDCGEILGSQAHACKRTAELESEAQAFAGLKRGKDYQICPNVRCGRRVQLSDGCNHIFCVCDQQLCFICGEPATASSKHWTKTHPDDIRCPRYNQPGAPNAMYDVNLRARVAGEADNVLQALDPMALNQRLEEARARALNLHEAAQQQARHGEEFRRREEMRSRFEEERARHRRRLEEEARRFLEQAPLFDEDAETHLQRQFMMDAHFTTLQDDLLRQARRREAPPPIRPEPAWDLAADDDFFDPVHFVGGPITSNANRRVEGPEAFPMGRRNAITQLPDGALGVQLVDFDSAGSSRPNATDQLQAVAGAEARADRPRRLERRTQAPMATAQPEFMHIPLHAPRSADRPLTLLQAVQASDRTRADIETPATSTSRPPSVRRRPAVAEAPPLPQPLQAAPAGPVHRPSVQRSMQPNNTAILAHHAPNVDLVAPVQQFPPPSINSEPPFSANRTDMNTVRQQGRHSHFGPVAEEWMRRRIRNANIPRRNASSTHRNGFSASDAVRAFSSEPSTDEEMPDAPPPGPFLVPRIPPRTSSLSSSGAAPPATLSANMRAVPRTQDVTRSTRMQRQTRQRQTRQAAVAEGGEVVDLTMHDAE